MISRINLFITAGLVLAFFISGISLGKVLRQKATPEEVVYARVEEVRHMRRLELVTYYFESMVDVTHAEKHNKSYILMVIPARVSSYIDLQKMTYTLEDSLIRIHLPDPMLEKPVLDLDSAKLFNLNERYVTASKKSYQTVVENVQHSLVRAKKDVIQRALANGIKEETTTLAEGYFTQLFNGLGFVVCFDAPAPLADPLAQAIPTQMQNEVALISSVDSQMRVDSAQMSYGEILISSVGSQMRVDPAQMSCGEALMLSVDSQMRVDSAQMSYGEALMSSVNSQMRVDSAQMSENLLTDQISSTY